MNTTPVISQQTYREAFQTWAKAIMSANAIDGHTPLLEQNINHPHGATYAAFLPRICREFSDMKLTSAEEAQIHIYCEEMERWLDSLIENAQQHNEKNYVQALGSIFTDIKKSSFLDRLLYAGETLRTRPCPKHKGRWSGLGWEWDGGCDHGCDLTGWLPEGLSEDYDIPKMLEERRQDAIEKAKKFVADTTTSPFTQTPDPEAAWREWKRKEVRRLRVNPAVLGVQRGARPTALDLEDLEWWKKIDLDILHEYLEETGWDKLHIADENRATWWKYTGKIKNSQESRTYSFLPSELLQMQIPENLGIIQVLKNKPKMTVHFPSIIKEALQDIAEITGQHFIDVVCDAQNLGVRPTDLQTDEFLRAMTPAMFSSYLAGKNWEKLGDDGDGNDVWQHEKLPKIMYENTRSPKKTRYLSAIMIDKSLNHDSNRAIKVLTKTNYVDYGWGIWTLINDLHRHEDRPMESIANDVMNTVQETINRQTSLLPRT